jgi:tetratricopeptide (TPR) repeat protein
VDGRLDATFEVAEQWYGKAIAQRRRKHYAQALACFDRALALAPRESGWWYWKGVTLCTMERYEQALDCFDRALAIIPDDPASADYRAYSLLSLGRNEEALAAYERALALDPTDADPWYRKGLTLRNLKRTEESLVCFERAIDLTGDSSSSIRAWASMKRAVAFYRMQRFEDAVAAYDVALTMVPPNDPSEITHWKGEALVRLKRDEEALACFTRALELRADYSMAAQSLAGTLFRMQRYEEALAAYNRALELIQPSDSAYAGLLFWKAETLHHLEHNEEALAACDAALALDPNHADWWIERSSMCFGLKHYDEALNNAEHAITLDESNGYGWKLKGFALFELRRYGEAQTAFESSLQRAPTDAQTWEQSGATLYALDRFGEAASAYDEALRLRPDDEELRTRHTQTVANIRRTVPDQKMRLRDGRWLGYLDLGDPDGAPIVYCHGAPSSRLDYYGDDEMLRDLHIRLVVPDRPGYGLSDFQPHRRLLDWPADVEQLADHLGLSRFAVLGASAGGPHALACAYAIPQRLTCVGVVSGATPFVSMSHLRALRWRERPSKILSRYCPWPIAPLFYVIPTYGFRKMPQVFLNAVYGRAAPLTDGVKLSGGAPWDLSRPLPPAVRDRVLEPYRQGVRGYAWDVRICTRDWGFRPEDLHGVQVYLWHGEQDGIVLQADAQALAAAIPGCHATFYPGEGHSLAAHEREILATLRGGTTTDGADEMANHAGDELPQM